MANYSRSYSIIDDNDPALERRRLYSSIEAEKPVSTNSDYIYATWQNAIALDNARRLFESINQRSKNYYNLACLGEITEKSFDDPLQMQFISQRDESEQNRNNPKNIRVMFDNVTPQGLKRENKGDYLFDINMKKENGEFVTISRTFQNFVDLQLNLSSAFPDDTLTIPDKIDIEHTTPNEMVEQSYSLHAFLNKITRVDKMMFSDVLQEFLAKTEGSKTESSQKENTSNLKIGSKTGKPFILFEIVSAKNVTEGDKKIMLYTIMMKKHLLDNHPVFLKRRYSDFYNLYSIFNSKYSSKVFNKFQFPKKHLISNLSPEQIAERAKGLEKFLNLIASSELVNSHMLEMFLTKKEHIQAVSFINTHLFGDAAVLLENIFHIKEKLLTSSGISVFDCLLELTACLVEFGTYETAFKFALQAVQSMRALQGYQEVENVRIPVLRTARFLAEKVGEDSQPFAEELARDSFVAFPQSVRSLLDIVRDRGQF